MWDIVFPRCVRFRLASDASPPLARFGEARRHHAFAVQVFELGIARNLPVIELRLTCLNFERISQLRSVDETRRVC